MNIFWQSDKKKFNSLRTCTCLKIGMLTRAGARCFSSEGLSVVNNVAKQQFEVTLRGVEAALGYEKTGRNITFIHTNVPIEFQGKGVGKLLAQYAFGYAAENKLHVTCKCHFLVNYHKNNLSKYKDLNVKYQLDD